jgi:hypothetical protein
VPASGYKALDRPYTRMMQRHHHQTFPPYRRWWVGLAAACQDVLGVDQLLQCPQCISRISGKIKGTHGVI